MTPWNVAFLIPCHNEERTIAKVVSDFRAVLPTATVYVYDNNSTDRTIQIANEAGAVVSEETHQGKGHVVRRMFSDIEADVYVLVDGDGTYDAASAPTMISMLVQEHFDMVVATRDSHEEAAYRRGHRAGNQLLTGMVAFMFGHGFTDMLSGYRVFSRSSVKSFPGLSRGFEVETELTVHALQLGLPVKEMSTPYYSRPIGSASKLSTLRDGFKILITILKLFRSERPLQFFGIVALLLATMSVVLAVPIFITFFQEGLVPRLPTAVLSTALMLLAFLSIAVGLILDTVTRGRHEAKLIAYRAFRLPEIKYSADHTP